MGFMKALASLHTFTGCVAVSIFAGLGKAKAFRKMSKNVKYEKMFLKSWSKSNI